MGAVKPPIVSLKEAELELKNEVQVNKHLVHASRTFVKSFSKKIGNHDLCLQFVCEEIRSVSTPTHAITKGFSDSDSQVVGEKFIDSIKAIYGITSDSDCRFNRLRHDLLHLVRPQMKNAEMAECQEAIDDILKEVYNDKDILEWRKHGSI